ncbi:MAG: T9SS type A sorting domain-containing protein [Bacteroidota bacterium]
MRSRYMLHFVFSIFLSLGGLQEVRSSTLVLNGLMRSASTTDSCVYIMENDLLVIEMESAVLAGDWMQDSYIDGYTGEGYIFWSGNNYFSSSGVGEIVYKIYVPEAGEYRFVWRNKILRGTNFTEHNDTWLKINGDDFFGREGDGSIVHPRPECSTTNDCPEGSSANGFFKVFGSSLNNWIWRAETSDGSFYNIFVRFDNPGIYEITINARSNFHGIDRMILYKPSVHRDAFAQDTNREASKINCSGLVHRDRPVARISRIYANGQAVKIELPQPVKSSYELLDLQGRVMQRGSSKQAAYTVSLPYPSGIYVFRVQIGKNFYTQKIMIG